jgi:LuxR family transcriptional regulator, maltose regulon positive regulatory protein
MSGVPGLPSWGLAMTGQSAMAKPPGMTLPQAGAGKPDGLLATKLYVPRPHPGFVPRPRLLDRLEEGMARGLLLVCAPAGFGKTALLAHWAQTGRRPVAWVSLDTGDNDPARFWRHVAAALDRVWPGLAEQVTPLLDAPVPPSFEGLVTVLVNQLAAQPDEGEALLIMDDYHLIEAQPVHASMGFLLEHRPPGLRLLLASRADPPLSLARRRGRGQLAELRAADLRFTSEEAAALLGEAVGPDLILPESAVAALVARTEGWAAGLQLAGLSLRGQPDSTAFVEAFSGSHRYVLDYLAEEVLDRQPDQVREFLLETSVLERLSGPLCAAVTGRVDSQQLLEQIERANLFLMPLDEVRGWWRYHQLFADLLRARLQQTQPDRVPTLHRAAAAWSDEHGLADDAIRHALAAGDAGWAARLVERHADELLVRAEGATLARWLAALPPDLVGSRPRLLLAQALLTLLGGRMEGVQDRLDAAERALAGAEGEGDGSYQPSVGRRSSLLANIPAAIALDRAYLAELRGDTDRAIALASGALGELGEDEWLLAATGRGYLAVAQWLNGQLPAAEHAFTSSLARWRAAGERFVAVRVCELLGQVQRAQGRLEVAANTYRRALEIAAPPARPALPAAGIAHVGLAEVAYQRDELDTALEHLDKGIAMCRPLTYTQALATGLATLAWIRQATGDVTGALEAMGEAERVAPGPEVASLLNPVPAQRARLLLAQGHLAAAARWAGERGLEADDQPSYAREPEYLLLARLLLAQGLPDQALGLLERLHAMAAAQGRTGSLIEIQALQALALAAGGDHAGAVAALAEAVSLAQPEGYVRVLADEGPPMGALLGRLVAAQRTGQAPADGIPLEYLGRLVRATEQHLATTGPRTRPSTAAVPGLVEALTTRELEVLRLLAAGKENQQIAKELVVAVSTVKKHVTHILEKLGAANRTEATARAREFGLLPGPAQQPTTGRSAPTTAR